MAFSIKIPLPGVLQGAFASLLLKLTGLEEGVEKAAEAAYPGAGGIVRAAFQRYSDPVSKALDLVAITAKAGVELGEAARTLHAIANPDPTDAA